MLVPKSRTVDPGAPDGIAVQADRARKPLPAQHERAVARQGAERPVAEEVLQEWLDHRKDVLVRRSQHRLAEIERRLEILGGYLIAYLNIDEVIRIIREEDEPKQVMMARWSLTDIQAEAILNMRLRALRKLEEFEIRKEFDGLSTEKKADRGAARLRRQAVADDRAGKSARRRRNSARRPSSASRRTEFADAPEHDLADIQQAMIEKEPITVVVSEKGWLRAMKGHLTDLSLLTFKEGDSLKLAFPAQTTDKILVFTTGGKFYTIGADRLPGGRGHGEPIRIIVDMENDQDIVTAFVHDPKRKLLLVCHAGNGFVVPEDEVVANTRKGKQVMNVKAPDEATHCAILSGRSCRHRRREPQDAGLPARRDPGNGARQGRAAAAIQGRRRARPEDLHDRRGPVLAGFGRPHLHAQPRGTDRMVRRPRSAGRMVPKGFPRTGKFG